MLTPDSKIGYYSSIELMVWGLMIIYRVTFPDAKKKKTGNEVIIIKGQSKTS